MNIKFYSIHKAIKIAAAYNEEQGDTADISKLKFAASIAHILGESESAEEAVEKIEYLLEDMLDAYVDGDA